MRKFLLHCLCFALPSLFLFALTGCDKNLSSDQVVFLQTSATSAKERAASFATISTQLKAADPANAVNVARIVAAHSAGLNAEAAALANVLHVVNIKGSLNQNLKDTVTAISLNSQGWIETMNQGRALMALSPDQSLWFDAHIAALKQESDNLAKLATALNSTPPAAAAATTAPK